MHSLLYNNLEVSSIAADVSSISPADFSEKPVNKSPMAAISDSHFEITHD